MIFFLFRCFGHIWIFLFALLNFFSFNVYSIFSLVEEHRVGAKSTSKRCNPAYLSLYIYHILKFLIETLWSKENQISLLQKQQSSFGLLVLFVFDSVASSMKAGQVLNQALNHDFLVLASLPRTFPPHRNAGWARAHHCHPFGSAISTRVWPKYLEALYVL